MLDLYDTLKRHPELRSVLGKLDPEEQSARYASFIKEVVEQALREEKDFDSRLAICNRLIAVVSNGAGKAAF